jgi:beta-carotene ketolase (CrtW type)
MENALGPAVFAYPKRVRPVGALLGVGIIALWLGSTAWWVTRPELAHWAWWLPLVLLQTHLYTGMFITAHDAMHGTVHPNRRVNAAIGWVAALLFAFNWYGRLLPRHHAHHRHVATPHDPDYHRGNAGFWAWYLAFARQYITVWQVLAMAVTFNVLKLWLPWPPLVLFWILPSILSTFQLFYFGTYLPHRGTHAPDNPHQARSQRRNHLWAFISCYFFGYHYQHHDQPWVPWWRLWRTVSNQQSAGSN